MIRLTLISLAAAALIPTAAIANDETADVRFDDLNLASPAGQAALERRIQTAARQVCQSATTTGSRVISARIERECKADVRRQVEEQMAAKGQLAARR
jgi:UrcA family protein